MTSGWGKMGLYGQPQSALGIIVHPKIYAAELVPMTDSNNTPIFYGNATYQNAGATGMVPNILGVRIHQSEHVRTDLASTGVNISTTNTGSIIQIVYFPAYIYGIRREVMINPIFEPRTDQIALYGTKRCDIKPLFAPTTNAFSITICGADITG